MATVTVSPSLGDILSTTPHSFLTPTQSLHDTTLSFIASTLNPVASQIQGLHHQRIQAHREARKRRRSSDAPNDAARQGKRLRGAGPDGELVVWDEKDALRIGKVHTEGFGTEQVWEQVRRVVEGVRGEVERDLKLREEKARRKADGVSINGVSAKRVEAPGLNGTGDEDGEEDELGVEGEDYEIEGVDDDEDARPSDEEDEEGLDEELDDIGDQSLEDDEDEEDALDEAEDQDPGAASEFVQDPNGLNDGFFSIDDFNKQSNFLENADARGDDDGAASDEEDVDWGADPLSGAAGDAELSRSGKSKGDNDEDEDDEGGPTFGDMDLDAPEGESGDEDELEGGDMDDLDDVTNANNIMYTDFFAPPAKKGCKRKKGRPHPNNFPAKPPLQAAEPEHDRDLEADYNDGALSRVHRDLFSDDSADGESNDEGNASDGSARPSTKNLSSHEKRQLALQKEIRALESTLISAKPWALAGEASSSSRPLNSLLEEDLAFERTGKPVPVVTAEISSSLEELIKSRIIAQDFQDIPRRRPDDLAVPSSRSRRDGYDLSDQKSKKSLAELYEDDHLKTTTGAAKDADLSDKDRREQAEILNLWNEVRSQLDSLSNYSLRPKPASVSLEIRTDAPVARLEDARPAVAGAAGEGMGGVETSALAPGEIYRSGAAVDKEAGEVLAGGRRGEIVGREERERGEGKRARRRAKERARKRGEAEGGSKEGKREREAREVLGALKKGGAKVIGKKGEVTDVEGRKVMGSGGVVGAGAYKL